MKKLGIISLTLTFLFSTFGLLPVKRVSANTEEERPLLMIAGWPWDYYLNSKGPQYNPGSPAVQNQTDNQETIQQSAQATIPSQESDKHRNSREERSFRGWLFKISFYLRIVFR